MFSDTMFEEVMAQPAGDERGEKNVGVEDDPQRTARKTSSSVKTPAASA